MTAPEQAEHRNSGESLEQGGTPLPRPHGDRGAGRAFLCGRCGAQLGRIVLDDRGWECVRPRDCKHEVRQGQVHCDVCDNLTGFRGGRGSLPPGVAYSARP